MKRVFWLMSVVGLTLGQSGIAYASVQSNQEGVVVHDGLTHDNIDDAINRLIARSQNTTTITSRLQQDPLSSGLTTQSSYSSNYQSPSIVAQLTKDSAPSIAAAAASRAARSKSIGRCALYVRKALQSAGYDFTPNASAYQYAHGTLAGAGFTKISNDNYEPQVGDVVVFNRTAKNPHGHIQIYDGKQWISDFRQQKFSPYSQHNGYTVWRDTRYLDASANTGIMLAMNEQ
ncbi:CHAP domain-containing protein [Moraxella sp. Tifton1]|uniref:CHAP domain-containing protein n=1 Tax=Moraxella oculi TaxID=2940516 RepID=A0ABW8U900_9GAMM|nr:CHAP domain-containing protein [Moraxella sp. Tifton1]MCL1623055.1 CHAP domain-containing protein [Moraxella sp. Tifton1]